MLSIATGLAVLFWMQSIFTGHTRNMVDVATTTLTGNLQIYKKDYLEERSITDAFSSGSVEDTLEKTPDILYSKRIHFPSILSSGEDSTPVYVYGIEPETESRIVTLRDHLKEGEFLKSEENGQCTDKRVYLGARAAKKLKVHVGDKLVVMGQAADGTMGNDLFRVSGIFDSGSPDFDKTHVFTPIDCVKDIAALGERIHEIIIKTTGRTTELDLQARLQSQVGDALQVNTWRETVPTLSTMIRVNTAIVNMVTFVFFLVITLGVVNAMLMNVFERTKEFGVMLSLGMTPNQVRTLIVFESLVMGAVSALAGTLIGALAISYHGRYGFDISPFLGKNGTSFVGFKFKSMVYPVFEWAAYLKLVVIEVLFIVAAGIYPAHRAAELDPVVTLRS